MKNVEKYGTARQATDDSTLGTCVLRAGSLKLQTHTHNTYLIFIVFPRQHCSHERASMYIACLVLTEKECVYSAVRADSLNEIHVQFNLQRVKQVT
jgi:hypothetical protein